MSIVDAIYLAVAAVVTLAGIICGLTRSLKIRKLRAADRARFRAEAERSNTVSLT